jgi:hypothetical protein
MRKLIACGLSLYLGLASSGMIAQNPAAQPQQKPSTSATPSAAAAPTSSARPGDVDTVEHIIAAVYDVISGPAGQRDWDRFRGLYYPGARMVPTRRDDKGNATPRMLSVDEYAAGSQNFFSREGFFEKSIANRVEEWDHIAHVWSTYESRHAAGEKPFARGINSFQLFNDGTRWWILTVYWESEEASHPLPEKYLK